MHTQQKKPSFLVERFLDFIYTKETFVNLSHLMTDEFGVVQTMGVKEPELDENGSPVRDKSGKYKLKVQKTDVTLGLIIKFSIMGSEMESIKSVAEVEARHSIYNKVNDADVAYFTRYELAIIKDMISNKYDIYNAGMALNHLK